MRPDLKTAEKGLMKDEGRRLLPYLLLIAMAVLVVPYLARMIGGNDGLIGEQSYLHARLAELAMSGAESDALVLGGREASYTPYHYLLGVTGRIMGMQRASMALPALLGMLSALLAYLLLAAFKAEARTRLIIVLALALSPPFIYAFTVSNPSSLAIALTLLGFLLFLKEERRMHLLGSIAFAVASMTSLFNTLLIASLLLAYVLAAKARKNEAVAIIAVLVLITAARTPPLMPQYEPTGGGIVQEMVSDLGGMAGFGIFYAILAVIGLFASWERKRPHAGLYLACIAMVAGYPLLGMAATIHLNIILAYFVGLGLARLQGIRWEFQVIRDLTFLIIVCGLLFSSISHMNRLAHAPPSQDLLDGLGWLSEHSLGDEVVLSHPKNGYAIAQVAGRPVIADSLRDGTKDIDQRLLDMQGIFYSVNLEEARALLDRYGVGYLIIDGEMRDLLWDEPDQGLPYLLRNNETFKKAYATDQVGIWKVI
jgi:hypothetical protein